MSKKILITGALSYSGRYIAEMLTERGYDIVTLEGERSMERPNPHNYPIVPFNWAQPHRMIQACQGAHALINTYWIRATEGEDSSSIAEERCSILFHLAKELQLQRIVHISVLNADARNPLPYFKHKGLAEDELKLTQIPSSIIRPAMLFGDSAEESILINNWAWCLRNTPVAGLLGNGESRIHPIHVRDLASLVVKELESEQSREEIDAVGAESLTLRETVELLLQAMDIKRVILPMPKMLAKHAARLLTRISGGKPLLVEEEIEALLAGYLAKPKASLPNTRSFKEWVLLHANELGRELV